MLRVSKQESFFFQKKNWKLKRRQDSNVENKIKKTNIDDLN
jgi:hypothetical protein